MFLNSLPFKKQRALASLLILLERLSIVEDTDTQELIFEIVLTKLQVMIDK